MLAFVVFPPFTGDGPPTCSRCFMYLRRTQYAPSSCESGGNSEAENRPRIPVGTVAPHPGPRRESATIVAACERRHDRRSTPAETVPWWEKRWGSASSAGAVGCGERGAIGVRFELARDAGRRPALRGGGVISAGRLHAEAGAACFRVGLRRAQRGALRVPVWRPAFQAGDATPGSSGTRFAGLRPGCRSEERRSRPARHCGGRSVPRRGRHAGEQRYALRPPLAGCAG